MIEDATDRLRSLRVADAMAAEPFAVRTGHTLAQAAMIFSEHHITWAPVIGEEGRCVGVFSVTDLLKRKAAMLNFDSSELVSAYMTAKIYTTAPNDSLLEAAAIMTDHHIHRLPVVDRNQKLKGVLSTMDIVAAVLHAVEEVDASLLADIRREQSEEE